MPLRASAAIQDVLSTGASAAGRLLVVRARPRSTADDHHVRIAVVASRRVGTAVARNRAKRLLREAVRALAWRPGHDVVVLARAGCPAASLRAVTDDMRALAARLDLLEAGTAEPEAARAGRPGMTPCS